MTGGIFCAPTNKTKPFWTLYFTNFDASTSDTIVEYLTTINFSLINNFGNLFSIVNGTT